MVVNQHFILKIEHLINKYLIYFNGGAWHYSTIYNLTLALENCYNRFI